MKQIDTIEQKNFADGRITDVDVSSGRKMQAQAMADFGRSMYGAADVVNNIRIKQQRLQTAQFETDLVNYDTKFNNDLDGVDWESVKAEDLIKNYSDGIDKLGREKLGASGYETWKKERGYGYKEDASLKLAGNINNQLEKYNYQKYSDLAAQKAVFAVNNPKEAAGVIENFFNTVDDNIADKTITDKIKRGFEEEYAAASALRDVRTAPDAALKKLKNEQEYKGLGAVQRERLIAAAQREIKAAEGTALQAQVNAALTPALELYNTDVAAFQRYVEDYTKTLLSNQDTKDGLTREQAHTKLKYMRKLLDDDILDQSVKSAEQRQQKQQQQMKFEEFKKDFNALQYDKKEGKFMNKEQASLRTMTDFIFKIEDSLKADIFGQDNDKELLNMKALLEAEIGRIAIGNDKRVKGPSIFAKTNKALIERSVNTNFLKLKNPTYKKEKSPSEVFLESVLNPEISLKDYTNEHYLKEAVAEFYKQPAFWAALGGDDKTVGEKNLGRLYINAYKSARKKGINLNAADEGKQQINNIMHTAYNALVHELHHLPEGKYEKAVINDNVVFVSSQFWDDLKDGKAVDIDAYDDF